MPQDTQMERLLRLRSQQQKLAELKLAQQQREVTRLKEEANRIRTAQAELSNELVRRMSQPLFFQHLLTERSLNAAINERLEQLATEQHEAAQRVAVAAQELMAVQQQRESVEKLVDEQRQERRRRLQHVEGIRLDERNLVTTNEPARFA